LCLTSLLQPLTARGLLVATVCKFFFFFIWGSCNESFCLVLYY
jgi:hypothetical protein